MPAWITEMGAASVFPVLAALVILGYFAGKLWRPVRTFVLFMVQLVGTDEVDADGNKVHPGLIARMTDLEADVKTIHHEVTPNSGGSIKDAVTRIESLQREQSGTVGALTGRFEEHLLLAERRDERIDELTEAVENLTNSVTSEEP